MVYRRRRTYGRKKRAFRRKRTIKRRMFRRKYNSTRAYSYKQTTNVTEFLSTNQTPVVAGYQFRLVDLAQHQTFTDLYDQYCITKVVCHFWPVQTTPTDSVNVNRGLRAYFLKDYDDATLPTSISAMMEYQNVKVRPAGIKTTLVLKPRVATQIYRSTTTTAYGPGKGHQWIDCSYADVPHYGVKVAIEGIPQGSTMVQGFRPVFIYYIKFRNVR